MSLVANIAAPLLFIALVGTVAIAVVLWPEVSRLRKAMRENRELRREHDRLARENRERAQGILDRWTPRGGAS